MTAAELRSRIERSGFSGQRLAAALGVAQPQVSKWCTGVRPIPEHHVPTIIELTDNPPLLARQKPEGARPGAFRRDVKVDLAALNAVLKASPLPLVSVTAPAPSVEPAPVVNAATGPLHSDFVAQHNAAQQRPRRPWP
jgi:transcriptional regulator with XRE-family HTH domain